MSEPESNQPKLSSRAELLEWLKGIQAVADTEVAEVVVPDNLALAAESELQATGQTWLNQELRHTKHLHYVRLFLLAALFILVMIWLFSVAALLLLQGFRLFGFYLSDAVIIAYITSTTVSVLGLFHIAAKWLFSANFANLAHSIKELLHKN
jgi:hypothetical protein